MIMKNKTLYTFIGAACCVALTTAQAAQKQSADKQSSDSTALAAIVTPASPAAQAGLSTVPASAVPAQAASPRAAAAPAEAIASVASPVAAASRTAAIAAGFDHVAQIKQEKDNASEEQIQKDQEAAAKLLAAASAPVPAAKTPEEDSEAEEDEASTPRLTTPTHAAEKSKEAAAAVAAPAVTPAAPAVVPAPEPVKEQEQAKAAVAAPTPVASPTSASSPAPVSVASATPIAAPAQAAVPLSSPASVIPAAASPVAIPAPASAAVVGAQAPVAAAAPLVVEPDPAAKLAKEKAAAAQQAAVDGKGAQNDAQVKQENDKEKVDNFAVVQESILDAFTTKYKPHDGEVKGAQDARQNDPLRESLLAIENNLHNAAFKAAFNDNFNIFITSADHSIHALYEARAQQSWLGSLWSRFWTGDSDIQRAKVNFIEITAGEIFRAFFKDLYEQHKQAQLKAAKTRADADAARVAKLEKDMRNPQEAAALFAQTIFNERLTFEQNAQANAAKDAKAAAAASADVKTVKAAAKPAVQSNSSIFGYLQSFRQYITMKTGIAAVAVIGVAVYYFKYLKK